MMGAAGVALAIGQLVDKRVEIKIAIESASEMIRTAVVEVATD